MVSTVEIIQKEALVFGYTVWVEGSGWKVRDGSRARALNDTEGMVSGMGHRRQGMRRQPVSVGAWTRGRTAVTNRQLSGLVLVVFGFFCVLMLHTCVSPLPHTHPRCPPPPLSNTGEVHQ
jgi:hypothetical protein